MFDVGGSRFEGRHGRVRGLTFEVQEGRFRELQTDCAKDGGLPRQGTTLALFFSSVSDCPRFVLRGFFPIWCLVDAVDGNGDCPRMPPRPPRGNREEAEERRAEARCAARPAPKKFGGHTALALPFVTEIFFKRSKLSRRRGFSHRGLLGPREGTERNRRRGGVDAEEGGC